MNEIQYQYCKSTIGDLTIGVHDNKLCLLDFRYRKMRDTVDQRLCRYFNAQMVMTAHPLIAQTVDELTQYLHSERQHFSVPIITAGSAFQQTVWQALQTISYGHTASYLQLAQQLNNPTAVRAVAAANGANAIAIIIPCHRIIGSSGELVGYGGGVALKKRLLALERRAAEQLSFV